LVLALTTELLSAAEKFCQQGKLQNAIAEYDKVLKPDQGSYVNNTIAISTRSRDIPKPSSGFNGGDAYGRAGLHGSRHRHVQRSPKLQPSLDST